MSPMTTTQLCKPVSRYSVSFILYIQGCYVLSACSIKTSSHIIDNDKHPGRIGPKTVVFDITGNSGTLVIEADRLGVRLVSATFQIH